MFELHFFCVPIFIIYFYENFTIVVNNVFVLKNVMSISKFLMDTKLYLLFIVGTYAHIITIFSVNN